MSHSNQNTPSLSSRFFVISVVILIQAFIVGCNSNTEDVTSNIKEQVPVKEVNEAYDNYKNAVMSSDGQKAASLVASNTIRYYNSVIDLVLNADSGKLVMAGLLEKFTVLAIRQTVDWKRLRAMNGKDLFAYAIEHGMIGKDVDKTAIGNLELKNDALVLAELLIKGKRTNKFTYFYREDGLWRFDLMELIKENELGLRKRINQSNVNETQGLLLFFKQTFGIEPSREVWLPVKWFDK